MTGNRIVRVEVRRSDLRWPIPAGFADALAGRTITGIRRRGKYLLFDLDDGQVLLAHLGMSGRMVITRPCEPAHTPGRFANSVPAHETHVHVVFHLADGATIRYSDPRRFGMMDLATRDTIDDHRLLANLGPDPLSAEFDGAYLSRVLAGKMTSIKAALLDQKLIAGLGNIYVCEALFDAGLSPRRLATTVIGRRADRLAASIKSVLAAAIEAGGSSLRDHVGADGSLGYFQHLFKVYGREGEPCPGCSCAGGVRRIVQTGRSSFYCPKRQR